MELENLVFWLRKERTPKGGLKKKMLFGKMGGLGGKKKELNLEGKPIPKEKGNVFERGKRN